MQEAHVKTGFFAQMTVQINGSELHCDLILPLLLQSNHSRLHRQSLVEIDKFLFYL